PRHVARAFDRPRRAALDTGWNRHGDRASDGQKPRPPARAARVRHEPARAVAARAGAVDGERQEPLLKTNAPAPHAHRARFARMSGLGTRPATILAGLGSFVAELLFG